MRTDEDYAVSTNRFGETQWEEEGSEPISNEQLRAVAMVDEIEVLLHLTECSKTTAEERVDAVTALSLDYQLTPLEADNLLREVGWWELMRFIMRSGRPLLPEGLAPFGDPDAASREAIAGYRKRCREWFTKRWMGGEPVWPGPELGEEDQDK